MRMLKALILAGGFALAATAAPLAQEVVNIAGVEATRVVIAPPTSDLGRIIKTALSDAYSSATKGTRAYQTAQKLYFFYGSRHFEPIWITKSADGTIAFSDKAQKILDVFKNAALEGFRPADYLTPALDVAAAGSDPVKLAALETAFSTSVAQYAQDAFGGRIAATAVNATWEITPKVVNQAELLVNLSQSNDPDKVLEDLSPHGREFLALKAALAKFYDNDDTVDDQADAIPDGPVLKPGMQDNRVTALRARLNVPEPEVPESASSDAQATVDINYDKPLVTAVKAFQESLGLNADGVVGPATIAALNGAATTSKDDIIANMERWRWEPDDLGDFNVFVNIPEFRLRLYDHGHEVYTTRVVVGRPENQTPVFNNSIKHIVVNPYWNVPPSIAAKEIQPHLIANPGYLDSQNMEMLSGTKVINASAIDWSSTSINNFHVRQKPGSGNALGQIKFLFPNDQDIYLHDTPSKSLFARSYRAFSHGCVRVQNPMDFANALLTGSNPQITEAGLEDMFGPTEKWVNLSNFVPVHLAYFTIRVDEDGTIRSFGDVYGMNKKLIDLLNQ